MPSPSESESFTAMSEDAADSNSADDETFLGRAKIILKLTVPSSLTMVMGQVTGIMNLAFVGHLNKPELVAGVGMGNMTVNLCALSLIYGFNSALDTLVSQAAGAKNIQLSGIYLNQGRFLVLCLFIPIFAVLMHTRSLLVYLGQNDEVATYSQLYVLTYLPGLFMNGLDDCQSRFLNNYKKQNFTFFARMVGTTFHGLWLYLFVIKYDMEIAGIAYANILSTTIIFILLIWFTYRQEELREAWMLPDRRIFNGLCDYVALSVPMTIMICLDWWVWEFMILLSGYLGVVEQASQIIIMHLVALAYMVSIGFESSSCALVGQEIGKGDTRKAKLYFSSIKIISVISLGLLSLGVFIFKNYLISIFTQNAQIIDTINTVIWIISFNTFPDCYKGMLKGIIKALGVQKYCAYINISGHWCINLTLQYYLGFHLKMGLEGLWLAKLINEFYIMMMYTLLTAFTDWDRIAEEAKQRQLRKLQMDKASILKRDDRQGAIIGGSPYKIGEDDDSEGRGTYNKMS